MFLVLGCDVEVLIATDDEEKPDVSIFTYFSSTLKMGLVDSSEASISVLSNNTASHTKKYLCIHFDPRTANHSYPTLALDMKL
jgi:hypothetical protein